MFFGLIGKVWLVAIGAELYFGLGIARVLHLVKTPSAAGKRPGSKPGPFSKLINQ